MEELTRIEVSKGFKLPLAYRAFAERGYMQYPGDSYLDIYEGEWMRLHEVAEHEWEDFYKAKPGLVAFAFTGRGDMWSWNLQMQTEYGEPAVVLCTHDSTEGEWISPCFIGWVYRSALEYLLRVSDDEGEIRRNLEVWSKVVREFGRAQWADDLDVIVKQLPAMFAEKAGTRKGERLKLLSRNELNERLQRAFGEAYVDKPFEWMMD